MKSCITLHLECFTLQQTVPVSHNWCPRISIQCPTLIIKWMFHSSYSKKVLEMFSFSSQVNKNTSNKQVVHCTYKFSWHNWKHYIQDAFFGSSCTWWLLLYTLSLNMSHIWNIGCTVSDVCMYMCVCVWIYMCACVRERERDCVP